MKRYPSRRAARAKASAPTLPGRYGKTWLSPEFVTWCKRHHFKPEGIARCILHTFALTGVDGKITITRQGKPVSVDDIYDLPGDGKNEG